MSAHEKPYQDADLDPEESSVSFAHEAFELSCDDESELDRMIELGRLTGGVVHDFNNLLAIMLGNLELARQYVPATSPAITHLRRMEETAIRGARHCQQLLAVSRGQSLQKSRIDLSEAVRSSEWLAREMNGSGIRLKFSLKEGLALILGDPAEIGRILTNLIINSKDAFTEYGGNISVSTYLDTDTYQCPQIVLEVADDGCGIERTQRDNIFRPGFTTKGSHGLGLSAVMGIVQAHGGRIRMRSEIGHGTTFRIFFPPVS